MAVWLITRSNLKRKKGIALSVGLLIALSVAMLVIGATLLTSIGSYYDRANKELNGADYMVRFTANEYKEDYLNFFLNDSRVAAAQAEEIIVMDTAAYPQGGALSASFLQMNQNQPITGYRTQTDADVPGDRAVYVPEYFQDMGYRPGDPFIIKYKQQTFTFYIEGYSQSTWLHSSATGLVNIYMPKESWDALYRQVGGGNLLSVQVHNPKDLASLRQDFKDKTDVKIESATMDAKVMDFTLDEMKNASTMIVTILSAMLVAFSTLIVVISMLVVRFQISNHIETQMHNIGALGAIGYTGSQIRSSIALEFFILSLGGALSGVALSYGLFGALGPFISRSVGLTWRAGIHITTDLVCSFAVMAVILVVSLLTSARAARILPVSALRGGISSHSFGKNHIPLDKTRLGLNMALGLKHIFFQFKTHLMVGVIFIGVAFALLSSVVFYMNFGLNQDLMVTMTGYEISDVLVYPAPHEDYDKLTAKLMDMEDVRKTSLFETTSVTLGRELLTCYLTDDYSRMETVKTYEGSFPVNDNEIVLTGVVAKQLKKQIGDTVELRLNGVSSDFIICGLAQTMSNFGRQCYLTLDGVLRLDPSYQKRTIQVYLKPGVDIDTFIAKAEQRFKVLSPTVTEEASGPMTAREKAEEALTRLLSMYGTDSAQFAVMKDGKIILSGDTSSYEIDHLDNNRALFVSNITSISDAAAFVTLVTLIGTLLIIILVFYMIIKSMLVRRSREFGIYKANGYTNRQLMAQIAVSFMPSVMAGTLIGFLLVLLLVNPAAIVLFQGLGMSRMNFILYPGILAGAGILLAACSFLICMIMAWKIRRITVYALLTE